MSRIAILTHYFAPEVGAPQTRLLALAGHLQDRGEQVTIHAPPPHYPDGVVAGGYRNRPVSVARTGSGLRVIRRAVYATPNRGTAKRLANHLSFAASSLVTARVAGRQDVVIAETPPLFLAATAVAYARVTGARLVLHVADRWPASAVALGALDDPKAIAAAEALERFAYRHAAAIAVPTQGMRDALNELPEAAGKVHVIAPAVDLERFSPGTRSGSGPPRVAYIGTVGLAHGLETLADAADLAGPDVCDVRVIGSGAGLGRLTARQGVNFHVPGPIAAAEVPAAYASVHAGIVMLRDLPIFDEALPSKLLEVLAAGRAALVSSRGQGGRLVERHGAGLAVPPEDPAALAAAFRVLAGDGDAVERMGRAARMLAEQRFGRPAMVDAWQTLLAQLRPNPGVRARRSG